MRAWFLLLMLVPFASAATIQGTVYNFELNKIAALITINSSPQQRMVAQNGSYSFSVPAGSYLLRAVEAKGELLVEENISVPGDGSFVLDLILLPDVDEQLLADPEEVPFIEDLIEDKPASHWFAWLVVFAFLGTIIYAFSRKPREILRERVIHEKVVHEVAVSDELQKVLEVIDAAGGRTTQKDIRKALPHSEAKVSLMLDELESKGLVKRIKKGRGNVVIRE